MNTKPIGVFDSGLGGLTLVKEIKRILPNEDIIYLGDTARVPYGTRSKEIVTKFSLEDARFLAQKDVKCIVIACNTASALAFEEVRKKIKLPIIDVITSATKDAILATKNKKIGVIGTVATISSKIYEKIIKESEPNISIYTLACPLFVPAIESGETTGEIIKLLVRKYLSVFKKQGIDTLILACTHYPIIEKEIQSFIGNKVKIVNPAVGTAERLQKFLQDNDLENPKVEKGKISYFVTDITPNFKQVAETFLGEKLEGLVSKIDLE